MKQSDKIRVAVLYGGRSAEHEISLKSATNVIENLDRSRFEVIPIGIDKQGRWFLGNEVFIKSLKHNTVKQLSENSYTWFTPEWVGKPVEKNEITELVNQSAKPFFDVVFPVVHGSLCEDGCLQGLLELSGIPYVGCGVLSSAIGMDKDVAKRLAQNAGVDVGPYLVIQLKQWQQRPDFFLAQVAQILDFPVFVKPANAGSSIGISKVKTPDNLARAISYAFQFDTKVLIEKALNILELELAVLESLSDEVEPIVSVVGEIKSRHEFYSYDAKYIDENGAELIIPARLSDQVKKQAQTIAAKIFKILECESMARVDLFLTKDSKHIYFNEINTIPGFTKISMYPKLMEASGISYTALLTHLIDLALKRNQNKSTLIRNKIEEVETQL